MLWGLALLAQHPEIQEKVRKEVVEVLGDRPPTYDDYKKLILCECVLKVDISSNSSLTSPYVAS